MVLAGDLVPAGTALVTPALECANSRLNPESHSLVDRSFLLTESFCKKYLFSVKFVMHPCEPFRSGAPHAYFGAHRLKSAALE